MAAVVCIVLLINTGFFAFLVKINTVYMDPPWYHHAQYVMLAESLAEGRVDLEHEAIDALKGLSNPYDTNQRKNEITDAPWDISYYNGKLYVYFGLVPELLFYFPYYLATGKAFPTYMGILICAIMVLTGAFNYKTVVSGYFGWFVFIVIVVIC